MASAKSRAWMIAVLLLIAAVIVIVPNCFRWHRVGMPKAMYGARAWGT
jgi:hypothetical protein